MGAIKSEEIAGFFIDEQCVCCDCVQPNEELEATREEVIVQAQVEAEDSVYFCDRCQKRI